MICSPFSQEIYYFWRVAVGMLVSGVLLPTSKDLWHLFSSSHVDFLDFLICLSVNTTKKKGK